jgi:hypothetical protein
MSLLRLSDILSSVDKSSFRQVFNTVSAALSAPGNNDDIVVDDKLFSLVAQVYKRLACIDISIVDGKVVSNKKGEPAHPYTIAVDKAYINIILDGVLLAKIANKHPATIYYDSYDYVMKHSDVECVVCKTDELAVVYRGGKLLVTSSFVTTIVSSVVVLADIGFAVDLMSIMV